MARTNNGGLVSSTNTKPNPNTDKKDHKNDDLSPDDSLLDHTVTMVKKGRFKVELVNADTKTAFKEHPHHDEIYVEIEPEAEYLIRMEVEVEVEAGKAVVAKMFVDNESLGYDIVFKGRQGEKEVASAGLWSYDGISSTTTALRFARSKFFTSRNNLTNQSKPLWTGEVLVEFFEMIDNGETCVEAASESDWKGGDIGIVLDQAELSKIQGTMTLDGNHTRTTKDDGVRTKVTEGGLIEILTLRYCSTKGMVLAGLFGSRKGDPFFWVEN